MMNNTMTNPSAIEKKVMRRVHTISILRPIFSGGTLAVLIATLALWGIGREVWVAKVFANGPQSFFGHLAYLAYAFEHTRLSVQALSLVTILAFVYLARAMAQSIVSAVAPAHA